MSKEKYNLTSVKKDLKIAINNKKIDHKMLSNFIKCYIAYNPIEQKATEKNINDLQILFINGMLDTTILIEKIIDITKITVYTIIDQNGNNIKRYIL